MTAATGTWIRDTRILSFIGTGHFLSHFYQFSLFPLILVWREEFGASTLALGVIVTLFALSNGFSQIPAGILVDRFGARPILVTGLIIEGAAVAGMGFAGSVEQIYVLAVIAGVANSVFHPADYAILGSTIATDRVGRAFSIHTFAGHLGGAFAPAVIVFLIALFDWRTAVMITGVFGIVTSLSIYVQGNVLKDEQSQPKPPQSSEAAVEAAKLAASTRALLLSKPMFLFFAFFLLASVISSGVAFSVVAIVDIQSIDETVAGIVLSAYLFASSAGILLGGVFADRYGRHELTAGLAFVVSGLIFALFTISGLAVALMVILFAIAGLAQGMVRPARDMMVRAIAPKGSMGRVFGYVSTGIALGSAVAPAVFGWIIDLELPKGIFWLLALLSVAAIATIAVQQKPGADRREFAG